MADIRLCKVNKCFGHEQVIRDVDLDIASGDFCVFVGPSGCGKSTLLRLVAGLEAISGGELYIDGEKVNDKPPSERGVAMVFQSYALYPHMSVYQNMAFGLKLADADKKAVNDRVKQAACLLQIDHLLDRLPKQLSGGQRQRVAIGRAIVRHPRVFLFDEPLSNLDAALRVQMRMEIGRLRERLRATIIYVTHDQVEAMTLATKIVVLQQGRVEQIGAPLELYHHPSSTFVAGFIGSPKMNFLRAELVDADAETACVRLTTGLELPVKVDARSIAVGASVTLGIRPEHVQIADETVVSPLVARIAYLEHLGEHSLGYCEIPGADELLTVQVAADVQMSDGDAQRLHFPAGACHLFDAEGLVCRRTVSPGGIASPPRARDYVNVE